MKLVLHEKDAESSDNDDIEKVNYIRRGGKNGQLNAGNKGNIPDDVGISVGLRVGDLVVLQSEWYTLFTTHTRSPQHSVGLDDG